MLTPIARVCVAVRLVQRIRGRVHRVDQLVGFSDEVSLQRHGPCIVWEDLSMGDLRCLGYHALARDSSGFRSVSLVYVVEMQCGLREEMC